MGSNSRKQASNIIRLSRPEVTPLEIWDCITPAGILWDSMYLKDFPDILNNVIMDIRMGLARTHSNTPINPDSRDFDAVFITGGGSENAAIKNSLQQLPIPTIFSCDPIFSGSHEGEVLLEQESLKGIVIDVGQTQLKISMNKENKTYKRDFSILPIYTDNNPHKQSDQSTLFENFIANSINDFLVLKQSPNGVLLALPCSISSNGTLGSNSYGGIRSDRSLISNIIKKSVLNNPSVLLLNDAELASYAALNDHRLERFNKILVITIGFGVGASIINRSNKDEHKNGH